MWGMFIQLYLKQTLPLLTNESHLLWLFPFELKVAEKNDLIQRAHRIPKFSAGVVHLFLTGVKCISRILKRYSNHVWKLVKKKKIHHALYSIMNSEKIGFRHGNIKIRTNKQIRLTNNNSPSCIIYSHP